MGKRHTTRKHRARASFEFLKFSFVLVSGWQEGKWSSMKFHQELSLAYRQLTLRINAFFFIGFLFGISSLPHILAPLDSSTLSKLQMICQRVWDIERTTHSSILCQHTDYSRQPVCVFPRSMIKSTWANKHVARQQSSRVRCERWPRRDGAFLSCLQSRLLRMTF